MPTDRGDIAKASLHNVATSGTQIQPYSTGNHPAGSENAIEWHSDGSTTAPGWKVCSTTSCGTTTGGGTTTTTTTTTTTGTTSTPQLGGCDDEGDEGLDPFALVSYILVGICGVFGLTLIVLLVVSRFTKKAEPTLANGKPNASGWGPFNFLFPQSWVKVWWGCMPICELEPQTSR